MQPAYQKISSQQTQNICMTFIQRRPNVFDVGPTLYKCYTNVLSLLDVLARAAALLSSPVQTNYYLQIMT